MCLLFRRGGSGRAQRGVSLVEVMIGMVVGLIATWVIIQSFTASEGFRRNVAGSADALQTASIVSIPLATRLQEAGAALAQGQLAWGCSLSVQRAGATVLPSPNAFPDPFSGFPQNVHASPVAILDGGSTGSDVLMIFAGMSGSGNNGVIYSVNGSTMVVNNSSGLALKNSGQSANDLLLTLPAVAGSLGTCQVVQVASAYSNGSAVSDSTFGGKVMPSQGALTYPVSLTDIPLNAATYGVPAIKVSGAVIHLGREESVVSSLFSVNSRNELVEMDLLGRNATQTIGENVFLLKVRYGIDSNNDNVIDSWVVPTGDWAASALMAGNAASATRIAQIRALRVALVMRSSQVVTSDYKPGEISLFSDLGDGAYSYSLSSAEQAYQYQVYDWVVPLRNMKQ